MIRCVVVLVGWRLRTAVEAVPYDTSTGSVPGCRGTSRGCTYPQIQVYILTIWTYLVNISIHIIKPCTISV